MDPVTALGVASSVLQLVDFTQGLVRSTYEIYKSASGRSKASIDLQAITTSLKTLNEDLTRSMDRAAAAAVGKGKVEEPSINDRELRTLCQNCNALASNLISALEKLKAQNKSLWGSFRLALRTVWNQTEVKSLEMQLEQYRDQIALYINASIREQVTLLGTGQSSHGRLISSALQAIQELSQNMFKQMSQNASWQAKVIEAIHRSSDKSITHRIWDVDGPAAQDHFYSEYGKRFSSELFARLHYIEMESRSESVQDAYNATFQWIFSISTVDQKHSNFVQFLRGDQSLYWITGKPGSGKSTLLKLVKDDQRTAEHLKIWAGTKKLYITGFYFWCSGGNEIQMTQEGLLRTLIQQALRNFPNVTPLIFPKRLETFVIFGDQIVWQEPFTLTELISAFKLFVYEVTKSHKIFLLIDGLDEFNGSFSQQGKLIEFIQSLLTTDVKVCVSSRPWNVFEDAFRALPCLRLEDLTYGDIRHYCSSNLANNPGFAALQCGDPKAASNLTEAVSTKACGVFLWVMLVVQSLLEGLTDGERLSDLQKRLDSLPSDLETLFWRILNSVDFERISQLLQIVRASPYPIRILHLSFADEDDPNFVFNLPTKPLSTTVISSRAELMRRRLNACSKGLLEPQASGYAKKDPGATVGYLHRTVKHFIEQSDIWDKLLDATSPSFSPAMRLCVSHLSCLKILPVNSVSCSNEESSYITVMRDPWKFWEVVVHCTWIILTYGPKEFKLPLFEEVRDAVDEIVSRGVSNYDTSFVRINYSHCASELSGTTEIRSFFHLAVKLQLWTYVNEHIRAIQGPNRIQEISLFLRIAVTDFALDYDSFKYKEPCIAVVKTLLEHGATLDSDSWHHVLENSAHRSDLLMLLLRHGADPFDVRIRFSGEFLDTDLFEPEVLELAKRKSEEVMRNSHEPRNIESGIVVDDSEALDGHNYSDATNRHQFTGYY